MEGDLLNNLYSYTYKLNVPKGTERLVRQADYLPILSHIRERGGHTKYVHYELDSNDEWHIHGAAHFELIPSYKQLAYINCTSKWYKIYNEIGWEEYASKDKGEDQEPNVKDDLNRMPTKSLFI